MLRFSLLFCVLILFGFLLSGCDMFLGSALNKAASTAGDKVGQRVGDTVGTAMAGYADASLRGLSPALMQLYVSSIFSSFFYAGGYSFDYNEYKPGQWSTWQATGMEEGSKFTKAFLMKEADGKEWWQIISLAVRDGKNEEVTLEALFSAPDEAGIRKMLRLRSLFPGDKEPAEVPVQENSAAWYHDPVKVTKESMDAATKGVESVKTPAGSFQAKHVVYRDVRGLSDWWLNDTVPGGLVKYKFTAGGEEDKKDEYTAELTGFGNDAKSKLNSFK
jgi:hypothetical protein